MQTVHPPKQSYPGTQNTTAAASAAALPVLKFPAGYKFFGQDVWRLEVQGILPATNGALLELYEGRNGQAGLVPIAVRGNITPTNGYQRPLSSCASTVNGGYMVAVYAGIAGAGAFTPQFLYIYQFTDASRAAPGFAGAAFKVQVDFVEGVPHE